MSVGRVVGVLFLLLVLYAIITQPLTSAAVVRSIGTSLAAAATSTVQFFTALTAGSTAAASPAASTTIAGTTIYTVRPGDTLASIASAHGTTAAALAARNGLSNPNHIVPGQKLSVS